MIYQGKSEQWSSNTILCSRQKVRAATMLDKKIPASSTHRPHVDTHMKDEILDPEKL